MHTRVLIALGCFAAALLTAPLPATAAARVTIANQRGDAVADPRYATRVTVTGRGFQSITNAHGGIYVFFGTVRGTWRPSQGGQTGRNYLYVPDNESKDNQGFQRLVAFPGSDTASSANGGTISADGSWRTTVTIPGATFQAVDRNGKATTIDCRKDRCGVITIGAHGVKNARNETFTPIRFANLASTAAPAPSSPTASAAAPTAVPTIAPSAAPAASGPPALTVERATAVAGRVLTFNATGLVPGDQIVVSLDDGVAAVGPLSVGPNGQVAGALQLPATLSTGTHQLTVTGTASAPTVTFAVAAPVAVAAGDTSGTSWAPIAFAGVGLVALVLALLFSVTRIRAARRREVDVRAN